MQREQLLQLANAYNTTLIDVGAGPLAVVAAEEFGCDVVCVDIDFEKVRLATEDARETGIAERLLYCVGDGARLPFADNSFAVATSYNALHHIPVPLREQFVEELARVASETVIIADMGDGRFARTHAAGDHTQVFMPAVCDQLATMGIATQHVGPEILACICRKG